MKVNSYITPKQVKTFCPSCNNVYNDFLSNVNVHYSKGWNNEIKPIYYATCYHCLNAKQDYEIYLAWQKLIFVNNTLSFNLSPIDKLYN